MAENEYLDSTKAQRWRVVAAAIRDGRDIDEVTPLVLDQFYKTLRHIRKDIQKDLPFSELVQAADDPAKLARLFKGFYGAFSVKRILVQAAREESGRQEVLETFLRDALGECLYNIPYSVAEVGAEVNISEARRSLSEVESRLWPELKRIAQKLDENPSWRPQMRRGSRTSAASENNTEKLLAESLITGLKR